MQNRCRNHIQNIQTASKISNAKSGKKLMTFCQSTTILFIWIHVKCLIYHYDWLSYENYYIIYIYGPYKDNVVKLLLIKKASLLK